MLFAAWFRRLSCFSATSKHRLHRRVTTRPRLEALEDRTLLQAGALDPTFSPGGTAGSGQRGVAFDRGGNNDDRAADIVVDSQGRIIMVGHSNNGDDDFAVVRLRADGSLDPMFSNDGMTTIGFGLDGPDSDDRATSVAIDPQGRIIVAGFVRESATDFDFAVVRLLDNGTLDTTFGDSADPGKNHFTFNTGSASDDRANDVAIDSQGRIILAGYSQVSGNNDDFAVIRLTSTGALDNSFDGDGKRRFAFGTLSDHANGVAIDSLDKIVVAGFTQFAGEDHDFAVARLNATDGSLDGTFGDGGTTTVPFDIGDGLDDEAEDVKIDSSGRIVLAGFAQGDSDNPGDIKYLFAAARLLSTGLPDTAFSNDGQTTIDLLAGNNDHRAFGLTLAPQNRIVLVGLADLGPTGNDFGVVRLNNNGSLDGTFGQFGNGQVTLEFPIAGVGDDDVATAVAIDGNGMVVVGGYTQISGTNYDFAAARLEADTLEWNPTTYTVAENGGSRVLTVTRASGSTGTVTVNFTTNDGTAIAGQDYTATSGTLTFGNGVTSRTITVPILNDTLPEANETFTVTLSGPTRALINGSNSATVTITDDDTFSISGLVFNDLNANAAFDPGEPGLPNWQVYIDRNNNYILDGGDTPTLTDVSGNYVLSGLVPGTYVVREVVQPTWVQSFPVSRSYSVTLTTASVTGRDFGNWQRGSISGQVVNDLNGNGTLEGSEPGVPNVIVYLDDDQNNTGPGLEEFTGRRNQITTSALASTNVPLPIPDLGQGIVISERLIRNEHGTVADVNVTLNITHPRNADLRAFLISPAGTRIELFNPAVVSGANFTNTTFDAQAVNPISAGTAPYSATFRPTGSLATFNGQDMTGNWRLEINDTVAGNVGTLNSWSLTFQYNERAVVTDGNGNFTFTGVAADGNYVIRPEIPNGWVQSFPRNRGSQGRRVDSGESVTTSNFGLFQRGSISGTVFTDENTSGDRQVGEPVRANEIVFLDQNGNGIPDANAVTINPPRGFQPRTIGDTSTVRLRLPVSGIAGVLTDVNVNLNITHTFDGDLRVSLISPMGTRVVLFDNVGGSGQNFTGTTIDDQASTLITSGTAPFTGSFRPQNPLSAFNGEDPTGAWFLKIEDTQAADFGTLDTFTLTLTYTEATTLSNTSGLYTFNGVTPGPYIVRVVPPSGHVVTAPPTGFRAVPFLSGNVITNQDLGVAPGSAGQFQFSAAAYSVSENASPATITVTRTGSTLGAATVQFMTTPGTATHGSDFSPQIGILSFSSGQTSALFTIPVVNDTVAEGSETLTLSLFTPTGGSSLGSPSSAALTILDDDAPQVGTISGTVFNDANGNRVRDGEPGLPGWLVFLGQSGNGAIRDSLTRTFTSTNVPVAIPDLATVYSTLSVSGQAGAITDLNVNLTLTHTYDQDLQIYLISPTGTRVLLVDRAGADGNNFTATTLDDEASTPVASGLAPFSGTFRPSQSLSAFDGQDLSGTWRLEIADVAGEDVGNLTVWSLQITWSERAVLTDANGNYSFPNLTPGSYVVQVVRQDGWALTAPVNGSHGVALAAGQIVTGRDFGQRTLGSISGTKFNDLNGDGIQQTGETGLQGWTIFLDQNGNSIRDSRTASFAAAGLPLAIPDAGTLNSFLPITGVAGLITDVNFSLNIDHTMDSNLEVHLHSPRGNQITLFNGVGGTRQGFTVTLDDAAVSPITGVSGTGTTRITGTFRPQELLSAFNGEELSGAWRLEVIDNVSGNVGTLNSWSLQITYEEAADETNSSGNYTIINLTPGTYTVREMPQAGWVQTGPAGGSHSATVVDNENVPDRNFANRQPTPTLQVTSLQRVGAGFNLYFNQAIDPTLLNLYDIQGNPLGPVDLTVVGAVTGPVRGSITLNSAATALFFIRTGGVMPADTYTVTLRSATNGVRTPAGDLLDGDRNGIPGDNYVDTFTVAAATSPIISLPDVTRGPGQALNVPATATGLPLRLSNGAGIDSFEGTLLYNSALLTITGATVGTGVPAGATVTLTQVAPGNLRIRFLSPSALPSGPIDFVNLTATVPDAATYSAKHKLNLIAIQANEGSMPIRADDGLHVVAYFGDTTGNAAYSSLDAQRTLRVAVGLDSGFVAYRLADPVIIADITGNGLLTSVDANRISQEVVGLDRPEIPPLPPNPPIITVPGPDPLLRFPKHFRARPGQTITVPLLLTPFDGLAAADLAIAYDAARLEVVEVRRGKLTSDFDFFVVNDEEGTLRIGLGRTVGPITGKGTGSVLEITFRVKPDAPSGRTIINLRRDLGAMQTQLNEGDLDLIPDPSNEAGDRLDGAITIHRSRLTASNAPVAPGNSDVVRAIDTVFAGRAKRRASSAG